MPHLVFLFSLRDGADFFFLAGRGLLVFSPPPPLHRGGVFFPFCLFSLSCRERSPPSEDRREVLLSSAFSLFSFPLPHLFLRRIEAAPLLPFFNERRGVPFSVRVTESFGLLSADARESPLSPLAKSFF